MINYKSKIQNHTPIPTYQKRKKGGIQRKKKNLKVEKQKLKKKKKVYHREKKRFQCIPKTEQFALSQFCDDFFFPYVN